MAAAAQNGILIIGNDRQTISVSIYGNDVANNLVKFGEGGKAVATSPDYYVFPISGYILDLIWVTGLTDTGFQMPNRNGNPTGDIFDAAIQDDGVSFRPRHRIPFSAGQRLTMVQLA